MVSAQTRSPTATDPVPRPSPRRRARRRRPRRRSRPRPRSRPRGEPAGRRARPSAGGRRPDRRRAGRTRPRPSRAGYELCPKNGMPRSTPDRYSRSLDSPRKRRSTPSSRMRSERRRCRSAWSNTSRYYGARRTGRRRRPVPRARAPERKTSWRRGKRSASSPTGLHSNSSGPRPGSSPYPTVQPLSAASVTCSGGRFDTTRGGAAFVEDALAGPGVLGLVVAEVRRFPQGHALTVWSCAVGCNPESVLACRARLR